MRISDWSSDVCSSDLCGPRSSTTRPRWCTGAAGTARWTDIAGSDHLAVHGAGGEQAGRHAELGEPRHDLANVRGVAGFHHGIQPGLLDRHVLEQALVIDLEIGSAHV